MLTARDACKADAPKILALIQALADYEHAAHDVTAGIEDIRARLFGPTASVAALMFEHARETVGFAVYFHNFSTWLGRHGLFLEDLYIEPGYRRRGFGRAAMRLLAERALDLDCARFEWNVLNWNTPAIELYEAIGARAQTEWIGYRLEGDALRRFVAAG
ncbi:GNAT family N-acetyltransferase [uncultured Salinisphaera sp.]|uniref:GNAT family N-acetyltransferase n=1 Tax=uncultured Salinisphaera sp. TaxID=359372 RepID=UPI0032B0F8CE|tara:strand:- start:2138 stop:2617 length:480 start_codon:yes stop_codon:yes gene_type:complete